MGKFEEIREMNKERMKDLSPEEKQKHMQECMIKTKEMGLRWGLIVPEDQVETCGLLNSN